MILRGKKNHYNIKFLKGYGFSINVKDSKIILKNNYDPFSESQTESWFIKNIPYDPQFNFVNVKNLNNINNFLQTRTEKLSDEEVQHIIEYLLSYVPNREQNYGLKRL